MLSISLTGGTAGSCGREWIGETSKGEFIYASSRRVIIAYSSWIHLSAEFIFLRFLFRSKRATTYPPESARHCFATILAWKKITRKRFSGSAPKRNDGFEFSRSKIILVRLSLNDGIKEKKRPDVFFWPWRILQLAMTEQALSCTAAVLFILKVTDHTFPSGPLFRRAFSRR